MRPGSIRAARRMPGISMLAVAALLTLARPAPGTEIIKDLAIRGEAASAQGAPPRPTAVDPAAEVRGTLDAYRQAIERKDLDLYCRVRPGLAWYQMRRLRDAFERTGQQRVELAIETISIAGDRAEVKGRRLDTFVSTTGEHAGPSTTPFVFRLRRTGIGWIIDSHQ
jgi:hypothetical protein